MESMKYDVTYVTRAELQASALTQDELLASVEGAQEVVDYFGCWESCHDSEILEIQLRHTGTCLVSLLAIATEPIVKKAILTFSLRGFDNLLLEGYFSQNQLGGVTFQRVNEGFRMVLWGIHGTEGWIVARTIAVDVYPILI